MKVKVKNDRLIIYTEGQDLVDLGKGGKCYIDTIHLDVDIKELAKLLKPYLDSIDNCEVKK
jgi:hypothetical protein